jgi:hypothetical protein
MSLKRWIPTFLAFPLGGVLAIGTLGGIHDPASAAAGGLLVGAVVGAAQWLALRPAGMSARWVAHTAAAMAAGAAVAAAVTGAGTEQADVVLAGLVTGAAVGAAQGALLPRGAALWTAVSGGAWALGWLVTSSVIVDLDRGHHVFGSSGALLVTLLTGLALRQLLGAVRPAVAASA